MSRVWTLLPHFCGKSTVLRANRLGNVALLCAFLLTGCGESSSMGHGGSTGSSASSSGSSETLQPIIAPPHSEDRPPLPGTTGGDKTPDGLPALQSLGVNTNLFAEKIDSEDRRIDRLENAVQELRNDFDKMAPAIVRLVAIEGDIKNLIGQLDTLTGNPANPALSGVAPIDEAMLDQPAPATPSDVPVPTPPVSNQLTDPGAQAGQSSVPAPSSPAQENAALPPVSGSPTPETSKSGEAQSHGPPEKAISPPASIASSPSPGKPATDGSTVTGIRVGEHPDKVRIVLDVKGKTSYTADLDNGEKILVVELPDAAWSADKEKTLAANPLIASYSTEKSGNAGTRLIIQLKKACTIPYKGLMNNPDGQGMRVIIDLASAK